MGESLDVLLNNHSTCFQDPHAAPPGIGMLNSPGASGTICTYMLRRNNLIIMKTVGSPTYVALAYNFILFRYFYRSHTYTLVCFNLPGASLCSTLWQQSLNTFTVRFGTLNFSIICIGSESCLWSIVGLPGSCAYYLTFRSIG